MTAFSVQAEGSPSRVARGERAHAETQPEGATMAAMGFGGLTIDKIFIVLLIALFIIGPEKLPHYAQ